MDEICCKLVEPILWISCLNQSSDLRIRRSMISSSPSPLLTRTAALIIKKFAIYSFVFFLIRIYEHVFYEELKLCSMRF